MRDAPSYIVFIMTDTLLDTKHSKERAGDTHEQDYEQVLWLDGVERKYVEEVGSMNIFFVIDGEVVTPQLLGSVLPGITLSLIHI